MMTLYIKKKERRVCCLILRLMKRINEGEKETILYF